MMVVGPWRSWRAGSVPIYLLRRTSERSRTRAATTRTTRRGAWRWRSGSFVRRGSNWCCFCSPSLRAVALCMRVFSSGHICPAIGNIGKARVAVCVIRLLTISAFIRIVERPDAYRNPSIHRLRALSHRLIKQPTRRRGSPRLSHGRPDRPQATA